LVHNSEAGTTAEAIPFAVIVTGHCRDLRSKG
jgi:hypothetical protein